ncbi:MAG: hypothetical protein L3V56_00655 [Candidatus Magnetoovum sp. WYHC-5]|nr:hypothetical protein [Candidatus Magnetoovum sp. WYHC-5]
MKESDEFDTSKCGCSSPAEQVEEALDLSKLIGCPFCGKPVADERELFSHIVIYHSC